MFTDVAKASANTDIIVPEPFTNPKYLGDPKCVALGRIAVFHSSRISAGDCPVNGSC